MSNAQYKDGYDAYKAKVVLSAEQLKMQHPLYRQGYRAAQAEAMKKSNVTFPTTLYDIPKRPHIFKAEWTDIMAATKRPRFAKLHTDQGRWLLIGIMKAVENQSHKISRYKDVIAMVDKAFDLVLQYGYDEGVLTVADCEQYQYTPYQK
ncbi:hypothetical protein ACMG5I_02420 [Escherichia coli]|uniref:hypothetical protein n=1 Tax=Escherichia coli TaxID=562 RepID=UPI0039BF8FDC